MKGPRLFLVFTGAPGSRYVWEGGARSLAPGEGVEVQTVRGENGLEPTESHFAALFARGEAVLEALP